MAINLSPSERLILRNQYEILSLLAPDRGSKDSHERAIEILESGYESHYSELMSWPIEGLSLEDSSFVSDVLDMFDNVVKAVSENGIEVPREHKFHAEFKGFDERCDGKFTEYAKFLVRKQRRFQRFKDLDFISDSPVSIVKYRKMLDVFHTLPITEQINLSASNLAKVLAA